MSSAEDFFEIGTSLLETYKYEKAIDYFSKAIELDPNSSQAYEYRGIALYKILKISESLQDFEKAVEIDTNNHNAFYNKGEIHFNRKEFLLAETAYLKANEIYSDSYFYLSALAETNLKLKKYQQAIDYCNEILNSSPDDIIALNLRTSSYAGVKNYHAAIKDLLKTTTPGKESASFYNNLGFYYSKTGELRKAENNLLAALEINKTHPYALNNLGHVYYLQNNLASALDLINNSLEIDPSNSYAYKNRALVYLKQNDLIKAKKDLDKAILLGYTAEYDDEAENLLRLHFENRA